MEKTNQDKTNNTPWAEDNFGVWILSLHHFTGSRDGSRFTLLYPAQPSLQSHLEERLIVASCRLSSVIRGSQPAREPGGRSWRGPRSVLALGCFCLARLLFMQLRPLAQGCHHPQGTASTHRGLCPSIRSAKESVSTVSEGDNSIKILLFLDMSIYAKLTGINQCINSFCIDYKNQCLNNKPWLWVCFLI